MYNKVNSNLSESQISKLKNALKNREGVSLRLSRSMLGSNEEQFPHTLMLTDRQVNKLRSQDSANIKFSKTQITKMSQSGGFLGSLMRFALPLLKNVIAPIGLTAAMSAADAGIQKKVRGYGQSGGNMSDITFTISTKDMNDIMQIIQALEERGIIVPGTSQTVSEEIQEQRGGFLGMLLGTLGASLLGNLLTGATGRGLYRNRNNRGKGVIRAGQDF